MSKKQFFINNWLILLIITLGVVFRFLPIHQYQFSHDELSGLSRTIFPDFKQTILYGVMYTDTHPALIQVFLWLWVKLVGYNEIWIKIPFLFSGLASIWVVYRFCFNFFNKNTALLSATFVSLSFVFLLYSSYARMYATGVLFSVLLLEQAYYLIFTSQKLSKHLILFSIYTLLCAYNHHMSCFFAFTLTALTFFYLPKKIKLKFLITSIIIAFAYLPILPITLHQLSIGGIGASAGGWLSEPRYNEIYFFIITLFGSGKIGLIIALTLFSIVVISVFQLNVISKKQVLLFWLFVINYSVIHLYSVFRNPILQNSVLLFSGITFIIFICSFSSFLSQKQLSYISLSIIILLCFESIYKKNYFSKVHVQDFESQIQTTINMKNKYGKDNVYGIFKSEPFFVYAYEKKYNTIIKHQNLFDTLFQNQKEFKNSLRKLDENILVLGGLSAGEILIAKEYFPYLVFHQEDYFRNVTVLSKQDYTHYDDVSILDTKKAINSDLNFHTKSNQSICFINDSLNYSLTSNNNEFPISFTLPLKPSNVKSGEFLVAKLSIQTDSLSEIGNDKLSVSIAEEGKEAIFYKEVNLSYFYDSTQFKTNVFLELFLNDQLPSWKSKNMSLTIFMWKDKNSSFKITDFNLIHADYNPTKWTLWD